MVAAASAHPASVLQGSVNSPYFIYICVFIITVVTTTFVQDKCRLLFKTYNKSYLVNFLHRIIKVTNFLNNSECQHIMRTAAAALSRSTVVDNGHVGGSVVDQIRTSTGTFLPLGAESGDRVVEAIERRIAELTMLPEENQEALQVLHYGHGEKYGAHMDTFFDKRLTGPEVGGERIATILMFLNEPEEGGETVFPNVAVRRSSEALPAWCPSSLGHPKKPCGAARPEAGRPLPRGAAAVIRHNRAGVERVRAGLARGEADRWDGGPVLESAPGRHHRPGRDAYRLPGDPRRKVERS